MTRAEVLKRTIDLADAWLERELENAELVLIDCGATAQECAEARTVRGYMRSMLQADRDRQIANVAAWLAGGASVLH